jgi:PAS domain S-box-containing protein
MAPKRGWISNSIDAPGYRFLARWSPFVWFRPAGCDCAVRGKLARRVLLIFVAVVLTDMAGVYLLSDRLLQSDAKQLQTEQAKQNVQAAFAALDEASRTLATTASDYADCDRTYSFMADPSNQDISTEFPNAAMENLGINLVAIRDLAGKIVFAKAYDSDAHAGAVVPQEFLDRLFKKLAGQPPAAFDGLAEFPDGPYLISIQPVSNSDHNADSRGMLLLGRRFTERQIARLRAVTQQSLELVRISPNALPPDFSVAFYLLRQNPNAIQVQPIGKHRIAGYGLLHDVFGAPILIMRADAARALYASGVLSWRYTFAGIMSLSIISSIVILVLLQRFVVARVCSLATQVNSIGARKALAERVHADGKDEISLLGQSINVMLNELENRQTQFAFLTENIHQIFWVKNLSGPFEYVSPAFERIFGRSRQTLYDHPDSWVELVHPDDREVAERMKRDYANGNISEFYYRAVSDDGQLHWLWQRSFPTYGTDGRIKQIIGILEDITEFKRTEQALLQAHDKLEQRVAQRTAELAERSELIKLLVESTPGAIYGLDAAGNCTFCNPECLRLLGYNAVEELLGKNAHNTIHHTCTDGTHYEQKDCPVYNSFHTGKDAHVIDEMFWKKDGSSFPVEYSSRQIRRNGEIVGAVVSFADITDRQRKEMELRHSQKLEAVGRLAAGIAHEINTPVQFVGDNARFLLQAFHDGAKLADKYHQLQGAAEHNQITPELLTEVARVHRETDWDYLQQEIPLAIRQMLEGLERVSTIVRGMKEFSHVDRSREKAPGDLNRALESTLIVVRNELKYVADVETDFGALPPVVCHLGDLNQVFLNLLVNAAHAIETANKGAGRKGTILVRTRQVGECAEVSITDSGTGIPEEVRGKMFDPFFTTKEVGKGTGQGLALARAIVVEKHGGTITFETEVGIGTTFVVKLPLNGNLAREEVLLP